MRERENKQPFCELKDAVSQLIQEIETAGENCDADTLRSFYFKLESLEAVQIFLSPPLNCEFTMALALVNAGDLRKPETNNQPESFTTILFHARFFKSAIERFVDQVLPS